MNERYKDTLQQEIIRIYYSKPHIIIRRDFLTLFIMGSTFDIQNIQLHTNQYLLRSQKIDFERLHLIIQLLFLQFKINTDIEGKNQTLSTFSHTGI